MKKLIICIAVLSLLLLIAPPVLAGPLDNPGKGPPLYEKAVFIHYAGDIAYGKPDGKPGGGGKANTLYSYSGVHWLDPNVEYYINSSGSPIANGDAELGIEASFQTWEDDRGSNINFIYVGTTDVAPGLDVDTPDLVNVVGWGDLGDPNIIGVTIVWSIQGLNWIMDSDTVLNTNATFRWTQASITGDPDNIWLDDTTHYDVDVQNIMTHEAGHWLMLNDLYYSAASEQTMYGYALDRELKARSLESGDLAGVRKIYR
jgi:hypothetical protein